MIHVRQQAQDGPSLYRVHPLLLDEGGDRPKKPAKMPFGHGLGYSWDILFLNIGDETIAGLSQNRSSWRNLILAWDRGEFTQCVINWNTPKESALFDMKLVLNGIETAGELADMVMRELRTGYPKAFRNAILDIPQYSIDSVPQL